MSDQRETEEKKKKQRDIKQQNGPKNKYVNSNDMLKGQVWAVRQELSVIRQLGGSKESEIWTVWY